MRNILIERARREQRGASAVEFALIAPVLFLLIFGIIDFGFVFGADLSLANGAREGVRVAAVDSDPTHVEAAVRNSAASLDQTRLTVVVSCTTAAGGACPGGLAGGKSGDKATVTATYIYQLITPISLATGRTITLSTTSSMRIE